VSTLQRPEPLRARPLLGPRALVYLYSRRLRVHFAQELLSGLGVAIAVALVFATMVANGSIAGSASEVVHAVIGPASLQLHARRSDGFDEELRTRVAALPGVMQAAPVLEQTATLIGPHGGRETVTLAGADVRLALLNGLAHTLPIATLAPGGIALTRTAAAELGVTPNGSHDEVLVEVRGRLRMLTVDAVLGREAAGALAQARVAVMPLAHLQQLADLPHRITRVLVRTQGGREAAVRTELTRLAGGRLTVAPATQDIVELRQALRPSDQASAFFAAISALLGFLFAFNAMLLTVPERRQAIADLRLIGTKRLAIVQMVSFQALCLGLAASAVGLLGGYLLSVGALHQSTGYLAEAFTLGSSTVIGVGPVLLALGGGVIATLFASAVPLFDLRRGRALDAVYFEDGAPGNALSGRAQRRLAVAATSLLTFTTTLFLLKPSMALFASGLLALATVLAVPLAVAAILRLVSVLVRRSHGLTTLQVALASLKAATLRSLALAATGAVAIFGGIALGGSRQDLLRGIGRFSHSYAADADLWVGNPGDNQATVPFNAADSARQVTRVPGVARVERFQGGFMELDGRRTWLIARPPGANVHVLATQIIDGNVATTAARLAQSGWITVSEQLARQRRLSLGDTLTLPTPAGGIPFKIAATTTNLAWSPGVIFIGASDFARYWQTSVPTALGVRLSAGTDVDRARAAVASELRSAGGLEVASARTREERINALTREGLSRLGEISTLLLGAAILAMAAALGSSIWQRRPSLAGLRLAGVRISRLRKMLLTESLLMLGAGCLTGAVAGVYGQVVIDAYLKQVTGFPVANLAASLRPLGILAIVVVAVLLIVAVPGWSASRVSPSLALDE
jgi:putative ABC transport system permease protein